ncbi:MAG: glycosyltransferase family 9 protein [bacterium]
MKILIIRFSSLGDIAMATALPRVLRKKFSSAMIDMVVREDFKDLIEYNPYLNDKIYLSRGAGLSGLFKLTKQIRQNKYDLIIDSHRSLRSFFICLFTPGVTKTYFNKRTLKRLLLIFLKINLFKKVDCQMIEYIKPLEKYGINYDGKGTEIFIPENIRTKTKDLLSKKIPDFKKKKLIGLVPSAQWPGKRWPSDYFDKLAGMIVDKLDSDVLIVGGKDDVFCSDIARKNKRVYSFAGELDVFGSAIALSECDAVVSNDTGMMHVAEAVGKDVIGIMGPTSYEFACYPYRDGSRTVELNLWCRPCSKNGQGLCIRMGKRPCLNDINPDMVFEELLEFLK